MKADVLYSGDILDTLCHPLPPYRSPSGRITEWMQRLRESGKAQDDKSK